MCLRNYIYVLCAIFWLNLPIAGANSIQLPDIGDSAGAVLSPDQERRIGVEFLRRIRLDFQLIDDPEISEYIRSLGNRLAENSDNPSQHFTFFVIDDPRINAFAAPGGYIGINSGLITASESESELASVMSHEIAHVTQRHLARAVEAQGKLNIPALAGLIAAIIIGSQNSEAGQATLAASQAATLQAQLNFTRSNENEADSVGIQTLAGSGLDPNAMASFFEHLQQASRYYGRPPEFLSTHPVTTARVANARNRARSYPYRQVPESIDFHLAREKLRLRNINPQKAVKRYQSLIKAEQYLNYSAAQYAYSLALTNAGQYQQAQEVLAPLLKKNPERISYLMAKAQILFKSGAVPAALNIYKNALKNYPHDHVVTLSYAKTLLQLGRAKQTRILLHQQIAYRRADADFYKLLAFTEGEAGYPLEAHQSLAEFHYLNGQTNAAIQQLDQALRIQSDDFYTLEKIQARRDQFKQFLQSESAF
ncbi:MAG: M48 family metallopeptidase [Sulfuriflexus sp.]|nr:M48 family metallopeptidase [Sulfuriflexus sp.]